MSPTISNVIQTDNADWFLVITEIPVCYMLPKSIETANAERWYRFFMTVVQSVPLLLIDRDHDTWEFYDLYQEPPREGPLPQANIEPLPMLFRHFFSSENTSTMMDSQVLDVRYSNLCYKHDGLEPLSPQQIDSFRERLASQPYIGRILYFGN